MKKAALYVHIPWCIRKCPYCDFNSHALKGNIDESRYVQALLSDLEMDVEDISEAQSGLATHLSRAYEIDSIFFGGGTPSLMSAEAIGRILQGIDKQLRLSRDIEITLEANPGVSEAERFAGYRAAGVNRLSIGVQSLSDVQLQTLGRVHSAAEAKKAFQIARQAGFDNINVDMMFALPEQTLDQSAEDLRGLMAFESEHISFYQLTLEPNTYFHAFPPDLPEDDVAADMQIQGQEMLAQAGYEQYEVSAYAQSDKRSRHNLHYWYFDDYLGIGAGAHGKWTHGAHMARRWKHKQPKQYLDGVESDNALGAVESIPAERQVFEFMLNRLRLYQPITYQEMARQIPAWSDMLAQTTRQQLAALADEDLVIIEASGFRLTQTGRAFLNQVLLRFLPQ